MYMCMYPYDAEYLWHVVPCVLLDDGYDLPQLLEEVLPHPPVTRTDHTQERWHYLRICTGKDMYIIIVHVYIILCILMQYLIKYRCVS